MNKIGKILVQDSETTGLKGNRSRLLCISYKWLGEKTVRTIRIDQFPVYKKDPTDDTELCKAFEKVYEEANASVAHYGSGFDIPEMNARRLINGLPPLPPTKLYDTWWAMKKTFNMSSNSLKTALEDLNCAEKKMPVPYKVWERAAAGHKASIDILCSRCESDVRGLEALFIKVRAWAPNLLNNAYLVSDVSKQCPTCGTEGKMQRRGQTVAQKKVYYRFQCQKCGAWHKGEARSLAA